VQQTGITYLLAVSRTIKPGMRFVMATSRWGARDPREPYAFKGELHRPRCGLCHGHKLDGNRMTSMDHRKLRLDPPGAYASASAPEHDNAEWPGDLVEDDCCTRCGEFLWPDGHCACREDDGPDALWRALEWWDERRPDWSGRPLRVPFIEAIGFAR